MNERMGSYQKVRKNTPRSLADRFPAAGCILGVAKARFDPDGLVQMEIDFYCGVSHKFAHNVLGRMWMGEQLRKDDRREGERSGTPEDFKLVRKFGGAGFS